MKTVSRKRNRNWEVEEKTLLKHCIINHMAVIENKAFTTSVLRAKKDAWNVILTEFNTLNSKSRDLIQLKSQWKVMKMSAKKRMGDHRRRLFATGGGLKPPSPSPDDLAMVDMLHIDTNEEAKFSHRDRNPEPNVNSTELSPCKCSYQDSHLLPSTLPLEVIIDIPASVPKSPCEKMESPAQISELFQTSAPPLIQSTAKKIKFNRRAEDTFKKKIFELTSKHLVREHKKKMWMIEEKRKDFAKIKEEELKVKISLAEKESALKLIWLEEEHKQKIRLADIEHKKRLQLMEQMREL